MHLRHRLTRNTFNDTVQQPTPDFYSDEEAEELELPMMVKAVNERKNQISELSQSEGVSCIV